MNDMKTPDIDRDLIRKQFPALASETVFLENAGGSQVPRVVADRIHEYMLSTYVQLDAGYGLSEYCTSVVNEAHDFVNLFMNGTDTGKVVLGPSCSVLCRMLADCYAEILEPGDEIIVAETGHEANVGPWVRLADRGAVIRMWEMDPDSFACPLDALESLLNERTRIVAFPHVSNLLGDLVDVKAITRMAHAHGAEVVVDGVAYAPHRPIDVKEWDVDWYAYSTYKVYGPHMGALYGKFEGFSRLMGPNHYFIPRDEVPYKFELGGASHEGCSGLLALGDYLKFLARVPHDSAVDRRVVVDAFEVMTLCELPLQERMINYLLEKPGVAIVGPEESDRTRVGTISFLHDRLSSRSIAEAAHAQNIGIRNGHMYAHRLCKAIEIDPEDGVVRISLVHYNTPEEIERLIDLFEQVL
jgi:cysteine desulfurase family protein (TIGR01976 family)